MLEIARGLWFQASLPIEFWGECVQTTAYIINKLPTPDLEKKTPHEILLGKKPTYDHFRVFGCLAYAHNKIAKTDKFSERGRACIFFGYPNGQKGYKLYDLKTLKIQFTRDVTFIENVFPFDDNYKGYKNIDENTFVECMNNAENFIKNYSHTTVTEPTIEVDEIETRKWDANRNNNSEKQINEIVNNYPNDSVVSYYEPSTSLPTETPRQSTRFRTKSKHLDGFITNLPPLIDLLVTISNPDATRPYPISQYVMYNKFSKPHRAFLAAITSATEQKTFLQASKDPNWQEAMKKEIAALESNGTWILTTLPP